MRSRFLLGLLILHLFAACHRDPPGPHIELVAISSVADSFHSENPALQSLFRNALRSTYESAFAMADGTVYIKTGDIPAEWLRDSSAQARPYLFFATDPQVANFLRGVIERQARSIVRDPYANAFTYEYEIWERKYELDSLLYPIELASAYFRASRDATIFTPAWRDAARTILETLEREQDHAARSDYQHGELSGNPVARTGMIWSGFRPSDDACTFNYLIPSELMAVAALDELAELLQTGYRDDANAAQARKLSAEIASGIAQYGIAKTESGERIYAYEVDGLGNQLLMDDGNLPNLLGAPLLSQVATGDALYQATRGFVLSARNPHYFAGEQLRGLGSPHTPARYVWPLGLLAQALTTNDPGERSDVLSELLATDPGDHRLHESCDADNATRCTRDDFGWPNALFSEMILVDRLGHMPLPPP